MIHNIMGCLIKKHQRMNNKFNSSFCLIFMNNDSSSTLDTIEK